MTSYWETCWVCEWICQRLAGPVKASKVAHCIREQPSSESPLRPASYLHTSASSVSKNDHLHEEYVCRVVVQHKTNLGTSGVLLSHCLPPTQIYLPTVI
jgi:hypothetical protein